MVSYPYRVALLVGAVGLANAEPGTSVYGQWKITGIADAQPTTSISSDDADKLTGAEFSASRDMVQFAGERCAEPRFTWSRHGTATFFRREYKMDPRRLHLPATVTEIEIACREPSPITFAYVKDRRHMLVYWRGFFLIAEKRGK